MPWIKNVRCCWFVVSLVWPAGLTLLHGETATHPTSMQGPSQTAAVSDDKSTSIEQLFEDMKKSFRSEKAKGVRIRYLFRFKEPQGGDRWIIVNDGAVSMGKGSIEHPDVTFSCTGADWLELSNGTLSGIRAYLTGRLHVSGSQALARKLDEMFP